MPGFYAYEGDAPLGQERLGTGPHRMLRTDLTTVSGARRAARERFGDKPFRLYRFTNLYDHDTFVEIKR